MHTKLLQLCPTLCDPMDWSPPGSSVHGILQARILECAVISSFRGSSRSRDRIWISCLLNWQVGSLPLVPPAMPHWPRGNNDKKGGLGCVERAGALYFHDLIPWGLRIETENNKKIMSWVQKINKLSPTNLIALFLRLTKFVNNRKTTDVPIWKFFSVSNIIIFENLLAKLWH